MAGEPGFEPGLTESESVGLPLTYSPTADAISFGRNARTVREPAVAAVPLAFRGAF